MSNRRPEKVSLLLAHAVPQKPLPPISVSLKELVAERDRYIMPNYQREQVWTIREKQQFIDSILLGDPFAPIEAYEKFNKEGETIGEKYWEIGDGQNRLDALISFMLGEFKTWTERQKVGFEPTSKFGPVEPGKFFPELSQLAKNYLYDYHVRIDLLHDRPESEKISRFLRVQTHIPLRKAEKLNAFISKAKDAAKRIEKHPFWEEFYEGDKRRKQVFQSSLHLLALEMTPSGIQDLQAGGFIYALVSGKYDKNITDTLVEEVLARMDLVMHVYDQAHFTVRGTAIAMYQSVMFLERTGYIIVPKDKGRLTQWINAIISDSKRSAGTPSYNRPIQQLTGAKAQQEFWNRHLKPMMAYFGVKVTTLEQLPLEKVVEG